MRIFRHWMELNCKRDFVVFSSEKYTTQNDTINSTNKHTNKKLIFVLNRFKRISMWVKPNKMIHIKKSHFLTMDYIRLLHYIKLDVIVFLFQFRKVWSCFCSNFVEKFEPKYNWYAAWHETKRQTENMWILKNPIFQSNAIIIDMNSTLAMYLQ